MPSLHDSDHYPIEMQLTTPSLNYDRPIRFNINRANWPKFKAGTKMPDLSEENLEIKEYLKRIENTLIASATINIARTSGRRPKPSVPWWNRECQEAKKERNTAERALEENDTNMNRIRYKMLKAKCRYIINKTRRNHFQNYVSNITTRTPAKQMWKTIAKMEKKYVQTPPIRLERNDKIITDTYEVANIFADTLSEISNNSYSANFRRHKDLAERQKIDFSENQENCYNMKFSADEFFYCLSKC